MSIRLSNADIIAMTIRRLRRIVRDDKKNIVYLLYYSMLEALLLTVVPLTSSFVINSALAHATISIVALSIIVLTIFIMIVGLQMLKETMIERFEQQIFVKNALQVAELSLQQGSSDATEQKTDRIMNYFFDVISIQKLFPVLLLNGSGLLVKVIVGMTLLLFFDRALFGLGLVFIAVFMLIVLFLGRHGPKAAVTRSDAKHQAIYFLQHINDTDASDDSLSKLKTMDAMLVRYVQAREAMFGIIVKQLSLTFIIEGIALSTFFIVGSYMVYSGTLPIGEFIASEIIIISITGTLRTFMKQIDYIYDMIEGFYKIDKLTRHLGAKS